MKRWIVFAAIALVAMFAAPSGAATTPGTLDGVSFKFQNYVTKDFADCTGATPFTKNSLRLIAKVHATSKPSEGFDASVVVSTVPETNGVPDIHDRVEQWAAGWSNQSIPANTSAPWWDAFGKAGEQPPVAQYALQATPGYWYFEVGITARTSGNAYSATCLIDVEPGP